MTNIVSLIARILLAAIFVVAGIGKLGAGFEPTQQYMAAMGVPGALLPLVIAAEVGGGLALIAGLLTRWAALGLAAFSVISAVIFHANFADPMQSILFMKNLAMAGGLLMVFAHGAGRFSLDARLRKA